MGPKKTWQPFYYHTTRHDSNQLTTENSTPLRHSSNPTSPSRHSFAPERRAFSSTFGGRHDPEQQSNAADLQESHQTRELINRRRLSEAKIGLSLPPSNLDSSSWPGLGPIVNGASNIYRPSDLLELVESAKKPQAVVSSESLQSLASGRVLSPRGAIQSISAEQSHSRQQLDDFSRHQSTHPLDSYRSRGRSFSRANLLDIRLTYTAASSSHIGSVFADVLPPEPLVKLPSYDQSPVKGNLDAGSYESSQDLPGESDRDCGNVMASLPYRVSSGDSRRPSRLENRPPMSTVLCRNGPQCRKFVEGMCVPQ